MEEGEAVSNVQPSMMLQDHTDLLTKYYDVVVKEGLWRNKESLQSYLNFLFGSISFDGKVVLDIGGGAGVLSFYAGACGAKRVICLEPEGEGGTKDMNDQFARVSNMLNLQNVTLLSQTFQDFEEYLETFDIIILHNSVNHLDEEACIYLLEAQDKQVIYRSLFKKLASIASSQADLIIADCSSRNIFPLLNLRHPLSKTIEWHKHQPPEVWVDLLNDVGFDNPKIRWSSYSRLGKLGWLLFANRLAAFFLTSHFCLYMQKNKL